MDPTHEKVESEFPDVSVFESELEWLQPGPEEEDTSIERLLLADRETLLLSSKSNHGGPEETAIWSEGVGNGLLVIARRLLAAGLDESQIEAE